MNFFAATPRFFKPYRTLPAFVLLLTTACSGYFSRSADEGIKTAAVGKTYYVDCARGKDTSAGTSRTAAWKSLTRANKAVLQPGETLLLKRNCSWVGPLKVPWQGTPGSPVRIAAFGEGAKPVVRDAPWENVLVTGSYLLIEQIDAKMTVANLQKDVGCKGQPYGWKVGFNLNGASYVTVRDSRATGHMAGVRVAEGSHHNKILANVLADNVVMKTLTKLNPDDDSGAWGVEVNGDDNEIAYNEFSNNASWCSYDYGEDGSAVEIYGAERNNVHHNVSTEDLTFSELGGAPGNRAADTLLAYNLFTSRKEASKFLIARGSQSPWGPTLQTKVYNNTVYLTGLKSEGIVCHGGCSGDILSAKNNVIWADWKAAYADGPFTEAHNMYWRSGGNPLVDFVNFRMDATSTIQDPQFVDPGVRNFRQRLTSPTLDSGTAVTLANPVDLDGTPVPQMSTTDLGAYEAAASFAASSGFRRD